MSKVDSKYSIELVNQNGDLLADLTGRAKNRRLTRSRNEADEIEWDIDLNEFERYCSLINIDPLNVLIEGQTEVRIKRLGTYLSGGQVTYYDPKLTSTSQTVSIKATGFLNLFKDRFTSAERRFTGAQATTIAWTLIDESQSLTNGNFGVTQGALATVGTHDRTYRRTNIKDALQNLTNVQTNPFDFEFTYDKVFNTYENIGSNRPEIIFEYPDNIVDFSGVKDASQMANQVIALGGGFGEEAQTQVTRNNLASQAQYKLRQKVVTPNGVIEEDTLTEHADAELSAWGVPFQVLGVTIDGNGS